MVCFVHNDEKNYKRIQIIRSLQSLLKSHDKILIISVELEQFGNRRKQSDVYELDTSGFDRFVTGIFEVVCYIFILVNKFWSKSSHLEPWVLGEWAVWVFYIGIFLLPFSIRLFAKSQTIPNNNNNDLQQILNLMLVNICTLCTPQNIQFKFFCWKSP